MADHSVDCWAVRKEHTLAAQRVVSMADKMVDLMAVSTVEC